MTVLEQPSKVQLNTQDEVWVQPSLRDEASSHEPNPLERTLPDGTVIGIGTTGTEFFQEQTRGSRPIVVDLFRVDITTNNPQRS